jgi:hypothetical protein
MKVKLLESKTYLGYKVVAFDGKKAFSLYEKQQEISLEPGIWEFLPGGIFLGTTKQFCINYYTGLSDDYIEGHGKYRDMLLTYGYSREDLLEGEPDHSDGEVRVKKAKLLYKEILPPI